MGKGRIKFEQPEGPAIIRPEFGFVQDRAISRLAGAPRAWRKQPPIEAAFRKKQLGRDEIGKRRFEAGVNYSQVYSLCEATGRDSTQALNVARSGGGSGGSFAQSQVNAIQVRKLLHNHMGPQNAAIIERVCGLGKQPAEALREIFGKVYEKATVPRFNEALDSLVAAFDGIRTLAETLLATDGRRVA